LAAALAALAFGAAFLVTLFVVAFFAAFFGALREAGFDAFGADFFFFAGLAAFLGAAFFGAAFFFAAFLADAFFGFFAGFFRAMTNPFGLS
jgi:hypothetical protein